VQAGIKRRGSITRSYRCSGTPLVSSVASLLCGARAKAELCTEKAFLFSFRSACLTLDSYSQIPVSLLRFASDIAEIPDSSLGRAALPSAAFSGAGKSTDLVRVAESFHNTERRDRGWKAAVTGRVSDFRLEFPAAVRPRRKTLSLAIPSDSPDRSWRVTDNNDHHVQRKDKTSPPPHGQIFCPKCSNAQQPPVASREADQTKKLQPRDTFLTLFSR
jgi:hypothetical protein